MWNVLTAFYARLLGKHKQNQEEIIVLKYDIECHSKLYSHRTKNLHL